MVRRASLARLDSLLIALALSVIVGAAACSAEAQPGGMSTNDASVEDSNVAHDTGLDTPADSSPDSGHDDAPAVFDASGETGAADASLESLRVASLNLHCLKTADSAYATNEQRFEAIAQTLAAEGIAAVMVQEACIAGDSDALEMLRAAVSKSTGEIWSKQWMLAHIGWQGTPDEAQEGVGILARGELTGVTRVEFRHQSSLRRAMIGAILPATLGSLRLWSVHLEVGDPAMQLLQAREAAAVALAASDPSWDVVIGGDFNASSGSPALGALEAMGFVELTSPLGSDLIDHVFAHRGAAVSPGKARVLFDGTAQPKVSDHPGVMVELSKSPAQPMVRTRFVAHAAAGQGTWLALRGSSPPLDWGWGWPAWKRADGSWGVVLSELSAGSSAKYKWLTDDSGWQLGDDAACQAGSDCELSPSF